MLYLYHISCFRYTILVRNPRYGVEYVVYYGTVCSDGDTNVVCDTHDMIQDGDGTEGQDPHGVAAVSC